jgi:geranylgeranylglycerol-phosphate geranylgeranyltransferase
MSEAATQGNRGTLERLNTWYTFTRPFTLVAPALGMISGGLTGWGAAGAPVAGTARVILNIVLGAIMAATLNAASNGINQVYDLEIDRTNKPKRMIPAGRMTVREAMVVSSVLYVVALALAWAINLQCFTLVLIAAILTIVYSVPPFRTKRWGLAANFTIAVPRGLLLKVAGWSAAKTIMHPESWYIGSIFFFFLLGASTTKDFADMKGDAAGGCVTLPIKYGVKKAAYIISPSFVLPFLLMPLGAWLHILTPRFPTLLAVLGFFLAAWGVYVNYLILRKPEELATTENLISWTHMYRMMFATQLAFIVAYWPF